MQRGEYSFKQWCIDNNHRWLLDYWRDDLNNCSPEDVPFKANKKYYFHCGNPNHKPEHILLANITSGGRTLDPNKLCMGCRSVGEQYKINHPGHDIYEVWSDKNSVSPYEIGAGSGRLVFVKCCNGIHEDYECQARFITFDYKCPYCSGRRLCLENSLGYMYPEVLSLWSDINKTTPFDYTYGSSKQVYFKCENGLHDDFKRKIEDSVHLKFRCPICANLNKVMPSGENHPNWNPDRSEDERFRGTKEYADWRVSVFIKDDRTCQCCGGSKNINAHHILSFAKHKDKRIDINNGITLCEDCHNSTIKGSLHNIYGTYDVSPQTLEKYINETRKAKGIDLPFKLEEYYQNINVLDKNFIA